MQTTHCSWASQWVPHYKLSYMLKKSIGFLKCFPEAMNIARQVTIGNSENVAFHGPGDTRVAPVVRSGTHECSGRLMGVQMCTPPRLPAGDVGTPLPAFTRNLFTRFQTWISSQGASQSLERLHRCRNCGCLASGRYEANPHMKQPLLSASFECS